MLEIIYRVENEFIEKLAHETAMASAIAEFNEAFKTNGVKVTKETGYILNAYYQHKKWAINEITRNFKIEDLNI